MMNPCPVCGYPLGFLPTDFNICPSCGTEFGYSDSGRSHKELRANWLASGAKWWDTSTAPPPNWNPYLQIDNLISQPAGFTAAAVLGISHHKTVNPLSGLASGQPGQIQESPDISTQFQKIRITGPLQETTERQSLLVH
ncbi:MAG: hypothetical protein ACRD4O_20455 [Bryobacteraceae bacterium]